MAMNFIAQSMRRFGLAPDNKVNPSHQNPVEAENSADPLSHLKIGSKWAYSTLEYPSDIQGKSNLGHYMMFYVNVPVTGTDGKAIKKKRSPTNVANGGNPSMDMASLQAKVPKVDPKVSAIMSETGYSKKASGPTGTAAFTEGGDTWMPGMEPVVIDREHHQGTTSNVIGRKRTTRTKDSIILYMPPNIVENYSAAYKEGELGRIGGAGKEAANAALNAFRASASEAANTNVDVLGVLDSALEMLGDESRERSAQALGAAAGSDLKGALLKADNQAVNNFLEVMFTGISHRKFSYTWKIAPKNAEESENAYKIIQKFKYHMSPEGGGKNHGRYYTVPSEFDIFYMFRGEENQWLHKISSCVLMNMDVNYTPNQYQTFRPHKNRKGAPPTEMDLKLDFMETRLITRDLVKNGY